VCSDRRNKVDTVKSKEGKLLTNEDDICERWKEHFAEELRPAPAEFALVQDDGSIIEDIPIDDT